MRIAKVKISNILGIADLEFDAGAFVEVSGRNGAGKTSVLTAIKSVIEGGHDATLIRNGEERGEVVLVLDDGTSIRKRISHKGVTLNVEKDGIKAQQPQSVISALTDLLSVNPVDFLRAPKKQRVNVLLESLPMTADMDRLAEIIGYKPEIKEGLHALTAIDTIYKAVFDDRTGTNRAVREKRATISQLEATIPEGFTVQADIETADLESLLAKRQKHDDALQAERDRITKKLDGLREQSETKKATIRDGHQQAIAVYRKQIEELNQKINAENQAQNDEIAAEQDAFAKIEGLAGQQREKAVTEHAANVAPISAQIATVQQNQDLAAKVRVTRQTVETMETEAAALEEDANRQTASLQALEAYKSELLSQLPIDGLEVKEGEIFRNGVPFDRLNSGQQVEIAVEIAKLRAGDLGVIAVDGIELLDSGHYEEFREQMEGTGLQMFVARVSDGDFAINVQ